MKQGAKIRLSQEAKVTCMLANFMQISHPCLFSINLFDCDVHGRSIQKCAKINQAAGVNSMGTNELAKAVGGVTKNKNKKKPRHFIFCDKERESRPESQSV